MKILDNQIGKSKLPLVTTLVVFGAIFGAIFSTYLPSIPLSKWRPLIILQINATKLISADEREIIVQTFDGILFKCQFEKGLCERTNKIELNNLNRYCGKSRLIRPLAPEVNNIIDQLSNRICGVDGYVEITYVLYSDKSVWYFVDGRNFPKDDYYLILGAFIGSVISMVFLFIFHSFNRIMIKNKK